jgi:hypothetical protein
MRVKVQEACDGARTVREPVAGQKGHVDGKAPGSESRPLPARNVSAALQTALEAHGGASRI